MAALIFLASLHPRGPMPIHNPLSVGDPIPVRGEPVEPHMPNYKALHQAALRQAQGKRCWVFTGVGIYGVGTSP